ncbi:hypothetical protein [Brucella tritici]
MILLEESRALGKRRLTKHVGQVPGAAPSQVLRTLRENVRGIGKGDGRRA